jgi:hypothetical protein
MVQTRDDWQTTLKLLKRLSNALSQADHHVQKVNEGLLQETAAFFEKHGGDLSPFES